MGATTRWKDTETKKFDEAIQKMISPIVDDVRNGSGYRRNYTSRKVLPEDGNIILNGENVRYNIIGYQFEQVSVEDDPSDDKRVWKSGNIVVYEQRGVIYYIIDQNSTAKRFLRKLLSYSGKNEIEVANFEFKEDFFLWLVCQVYNSAEAIEYDLGEEKKILQLEAIKGIRGDTEDLQTKITASGETLMNTISVLSFLFESRKLNQVILNLKYTGHQNICVKLQKDTVEYQAPYVGEYLDNSSVEFLAKLYLLLYIEILPLLEQEYRMNIVDDIWNQDAYITFWMGIKESIIESIENKIKTIK